MDCVIPFHARDQSLPYCVSSVKKLSEIDRVLLVSAPKNEPLARRLGIDFIHEDEFVAGLKRSSAHWLFGLLTPLERLARRLGERFEVPLMGWIHQQLLKYGAAFSPHVRSRHYLAVDADTVFLRRVPLFEGSRALIFRGPIFDRVTPAYAKVFDGLAERRFRVFNSTGHQFICHNMVFDRRRIWELVGRMEKSGWFAKMRLRLRRALWHVEHGLFWRELTLRELRHFSEYQLYAQYMLLQHPTEIKVRSELWGEFPWRMSWFADEREASTRMLARLGAFDAPSLAYCSFHPWLSEAFGLARLGVLDVAPIYEASATPLALHRELLKLPTVSSARRRYLEHHVARLEASYFV